MNEKEKNASIEYILAQGLVKPQTTRERIWEMINTIGFRYIFWDTGYSLFFTAVTITVIVVLFAVSPSDYRYSFSIAAAPLLFLLITAFTETTERACGLYELKQTCRYSIRQITALRIMCYGVAGSVFAALIAVIGANDVYEFLSMFPLCLSALAVCAVLSLTAMRYIRSRWVCAAFSAAWAFMSIAPAFTYNTAWETFLSKFPVVVSCAIALTGFVIFAFQISRMLSEVKRYAFTQ
jgi:hypothetical protein